MAFTWSLSDEDGDLINAAAGEWMKREKWPPRPAELIALANEIRDRQIREGVRSLPTPDVEYTSLAKLLELKATMESMGIKNKHIDRCIAEARVREGVAA